jgi:hypothetical protein
MKIRRSHALLLGCCASLAAHCAPGGEDFTTISSVDPVSADVAGRSGDVAGERRDKGLIAPGASWGAGTTIKVCWTDDSDAPEDQRKSLSNMVQSTWAGYANVSFDWQENGTWRICDRGDDPVDVIVFQDTINSHSCARIGPVSRTVAGMACTKSDPACDPNVQECAGKHRYADVVIATAGRGKYVHEFGHVIGMLHEHARSDATTCPDEYDSHAQDLNPSWQEIGVYDPESIMNYCRTRTGYELTETDVFTAQYLYGAKPTRPTWRASSWLPTTITARTIDSRGSDTITVLANVTTTATTVTSTETLAAGDDYQTDLSPTVPTLRCVTTRPHAGFVYGNPAHALPHDFAEGSIDVMCFDPATLAASILG